MNYRPIMCRFIILIALAVLFPAAADDKPPATDATYFEQRIRPMLEKHCLLCHGGEKTRNGLAVTSRGALLKGGERGPAVIPGKPEQSLLIESVRYDGQRVRMPPAGKLKAEQIADLEEWIRRGAMWGK